jgi:hypothetical protein
MVRHQVFLVHGMGSFEKDWSLDVQQLLRNAFQQYGRVKALAFGEQIEFVEINYNDIFEDTRALWKTNASAAAAALLAEGLADSAVSRLVELANGASGNNFFSTHVLDVILYRFFRAVRERVQQSVREQILARLDAFPQNARPSWSVIAHSLGTAVTHDTLHGMFTQTVNGLLLGPGFKPDFIFMVANVSKLLWSAGGSFYASAVRPNPVDTAGMCWRYCSFRHELDPIPQVDPFDPPVSWFPEGSTPAERKGLLFNGPPIKAADTQDINVHGLTHYLGHPLVHAEIINTLHGGPVPIIRQAELDAALATWRQSTLAAAALKDAKDALKSAAGAKVGDWKSIIESLTAFRTAVRSMTRLKDGE